MARNDNNRNNLTASAFAGLFGGSSLLLLSKIIESIEIENKNIEITFIFLISLIFMWLYVKYAEKAINYSEPSISINFENNSKITPRHPSAVHVSFCCNSKQDIEV